MAEWMSKQITGDISSFITMAKSPVMEDRGPERGMLQQRQQRD